MFSEKLNLLLNMGGSMGSNKRNYDFGPEHGIQRSNITSGGIGGRAGLEALIEDYLIGLGGTGSWWKSKEEMPLNIPDRSYNSRGIDLQKLDAYLQTPGGSRFSVDVMHPFDPERRGFMTRMKMPF